MTRDDRPEAQSLSLKPKPDDLASIRDDIGDCTRCKLCTLGRKQIVFGVGNPNADLMFVGEAPGRDEDIQGDAVRRARGAEADADHRSDRPEARGRLHRQRDQVPAAGEPQSRAGRSGDLRAVSVPADRRHQAEGDRRARHVRRAVAAQDRRADLAPARARVYDYRGAKLIPTFHPAYLLRNPGCRREVWEDMKKARALLTASDGREVAFVFRRRSCSISRPADVSGARRA